MKRIIALFILFLVLNQLPGQNTIKPITSEPDSADQDYSAYVIFKNDTLFPIKSSVGPFDPHERAELINKKLKNLSRDLIEVEDSFSVQNIDGHTIILYKKLMIMSITNADAKASGHSKVYLAANYIDIIEASLRSNIENRSFKFWIVRIGLTILTLAGLIIIFYLLNKLFKWIKQKLVDYEKNMTRQRWNLFRYLTPRGPEYFFVFILNILKFALIILILFLYLPLLFSFLPWTKEIVNQFYSFIASPVKFILKGALDFLPNLFFIIIIVLFARYLVKILSHVSVEIERDRIRLKGFHKDWAKPTLNLLKIIIYAFALVFIFPYLPGSDSPAFQGISIFLGVLFSLGSTSAIANIVAGIVITYMRPFKVGDRVKIADTIGDVMEKTLLVTKIRTLKNEDVTIPNATIINNHLWNFTAYTYDLGVILHTSVTIGYDVSWKIVNELLINAAEKTELTLKDPKPFVLQKSLDDFYVNHELNVYTKKTEKMMVIYSDLHKNILDEFNKANVEILSPNYSAFRDGNDSTVVSDNRNPIEKIINPEKK